MGYRENKLCSETSDAVATTWEHAHLEIQNFLKISITLLIRTLKEPEMGICATSKTSDIDKSSFFG